MELVSALYRFLANNDIDAKEFSVDVKKLYNRLLEMEPDTIQKWLTDTGLAFREELIRARSSSTKSYIRKAEEYVRNNYADETLSLDFICELLGVSNSYFSTTFKRETGKLIETNEKSYVIAQNVGYTDSNYFSYVFKRRFGVSPSKYRTEHIKE